MRKWLLLGSLCLGQIITEAQIVGRLFYTKNWELTLKDSAVYFRVVVIDTAWQTFVGPVKDYTKNGKLIMSGTYTAGIKNGHFIGYYASGKTEWEGEYADGRRSGFWRYYHPNGNLRSEFFFQNGTINLVKNLDSVGFVLFENGNGRWMEKYFRAGKDLITVEGSFKNSVPDGTWSWTMQDGTVWSSTTWKEGRFINGFIIEDGKRFELTQSQPFDFPDHYKHLSTELFYVADSAASSNYPYLKRPRWARDEVFVIVEESAHPVGGMSAFYKEIAGQLIGRYPKDARQRGIQGKVFVEFVIERDGTLTNFKVIKGVYPSLDELALRVVELSQINVKWAPGLQRGKPVRQKYTLPIIFRLGR